MAYIDEPERQPDKEHLKLEKTRKEEAKSEAKEAEREKEKTEKERLLDKWEAKEKKRMLENVHEDK